MRHSKLALIILLLGIPVASLFYKMQFLGIQVVPEKASNFWSVELSINKELPREFSVDYQGAPIMPIPSLNKYQRIKDLKLNGESLSVDAPPESKDYVSIELIEGQPADSVLSFQIQPRNAQMAQRDPVENLQRSEKKAYLSLEGYTADELVHLNKLKDTLIFPSDDKKTKFDKFFYYLADEIALKHDSRKISDVTELSSGSFLAQARTLVGLSRLSDIPARVIFGALFLEPKPAKPVRYTRVFLTEVFINGQWSPYLPEKRIDGQLDGDQLIFCRNCESQATMLENDNILNLRIEPVKYDPISSEEQLSRLETMSPFWASLSLHRLPLSVQAIILGIILVPFGTIAISFARVILGVETFGIFMPILLTLFFLETSFLFGFLFFAIVVLLGLGQRYVLDRFYLLAVPRLSILLSFTIIVYLLFAILCLRLDILTETQRSLSYFPIVIITVFIEKLSLSIMEEGPINTVKTAIGTFFVSIICYGLLAVSWLKTFFFNNPEVILFSVGMNMLIGSYTGFRLLELLRFKEVDEDNAINFK